MALSKEAERNLPGIVGNSVARELVSAMNSGSNAGAPFSAGCSTTLLGLFGVTPVVRASAYTQTYATAGKTHATPTATALTDNSAGTANTVLEALVSGTVYATDAASIRNNFADLTATVNALIVDLANAKQVLNSVIDDLQAYGLFQ